MRRIIYQTIVGGAVGFPGIKELERAKVITVYNLPSPREIGIFNRQGYWVVVEDYQG